MRICSILCVVCAVSLTACSSSDPQVRRGEVTSTSADTATNTTTPVTRPETDAPTESVSDEPPKKAIAGGAVDLEKLSFTVPDQWQPKQPSSSFVLAEFALPKSEGDEADGRLTVSTAGGSVEANVSRWRDQFGGKPEPAKEETKEINGLKVTLVDFGGEFNDQRGPFGPGTKRAAYRMLGAIIPVDGELHFVKATGPQATMAAHAESFQKFIESAKKK